MERVEFQPEQKAKVRNSGEGLSLKPDSYIEVKSLLKNRNPLTRVCQSSQTYPTSPSERFAAQNGKTSKKAAFTLTEVLVALSIVGIIAALVLPAVITNYQNKGFEQAFKRETQTIQSAIEGLAVSENKANFFDTMMNKTTAETTGEENYDDSSKLFIQKYLRASKICDTNTDCFADKYYEYADGDKKVYTPTLKGACAKLKNGMSICLTPQYSLTNEDGTKTTIPITGIIDLNGAKGPNVLGKDLRTFTLSTNTKNGRNATTDTVLSYDFDPIVPSADDDDDEDPCEGQTCGCGDLPDCPTCSTTPESSWSEQCCLENTSKITPVHHCCSYDNFKNSSYCKPACTNPDPTNSSRCCDTATITSSSDSCCSISSIYNSNLKCQGKTERSCQLMYTCYVIKDSSSACSARAYHCSPLASKFHLFFNTNITSAVGLSAMKCSSGNTEDICSLTQTYAKNDVPIFDYMQIGIEGTPYICGMRISAESQKFYTDVASTPSQRLYIQNYIYYYADENGNFKEWKKLEKNSSNANCSFMYQSNGAGGGADFEYYYPGYWRNMHTNEEADVSEIVF